MQYVTDWASPDRRSLLTFSEGTLEVFKRYAQFGEDAPESGGILLGQVRGEHLEILHATVPSLRDARRRTFFERDTFSHSSQANKLWRASGGLVRYLGEWHTHPEANPSPSLLDRTEWKKLVSLRLDRRPLLVVIVGTESLRVEQVLREAKDIRMEPIE